jgi:hypothetical protein
VARRRRALSREDRMDLVSIAMGLALFVAMLVAIELLERV